VTGSGGRYETIGRTYSRTRREDPRIAAAIHSALGAGTVVNVGAGSGNYEPADRVVVAVEPSPQMSRQRTRRQARVVRGVAEALPLADGSFDVALAVLTVHHWSDPAAGLREMRRVAARQVVFFFESTRTHEFWAFDYFPTARSLPTETDTPGERLLRRHLHVTEVLVVPVPHDCIDGFGVAYWARPEAYLDADVQAGMSCLAMLPADELREGAARLRVDLASGAWDRRHGHLRRQDVFDGGYRIASAGDD
jgi:SAM-dependent methyltransferase